MKIRSKHNDLFNYFVHDTRDLSPAYVKHCEKFLKELSLKQQAPSSKLQAPSVKLQATKDLTRPELWENMGIMKNKLKDINDELLKFYNRPGMALHFQPTNLKVLKELIARLIELEDEC